MESVPENAGILRFVLQQPSPLWREFRIEQVELFTLRTSQVPLIFTKYSKFVNEITVNSQFYSFFNGFVESRTRLKHPTARSHRCFFRTTCRMDLPYLELDGFANTLTKI